MATESRATFTRMRDATAADYEPIIARAIEDVTGLPDRVLAATVLEPFIPRELTWITRHHPVFQFYYYGVRIGVDPNLRERYRGHEYFDATVEFCETYDENCFEPT